MRLPFGIINNVNGMIYKFSGPYSYTKEILDNWESYDIGVYYCGYKTNEGTLIILYIGKATGEGGIKSRLLDHLREDRWPDVTHFGFHLCDYVRETEDHEAAEIKRFKPKYNQVGVI